jgi:hypothetical protein
MDKNIIKKHLTQFVNEAKNETSKTPGIDGTKAVIKKSGEENKKGVNDMNKDLASYEKSLNTNIDNTEIVKNKFNYSDEKEKEFHEQMEIMNGQEMIQYDRDPITEFQERALEAIEGSTRMGNNPEWANVVPEQIGFTGPDFGKNLVKNARASFDKRVAASTGIMSFGDDIETIPKGAQPMQIFSALGENNNKNNNKPQIKEGMKRLNFKKEFNGVGNALKMIPESYRVDNKTFEMTDGVENYKIRWEGTLTEGRAIVLMASDKTMVNEDMAHMKHLMGYKSNETLGLVKGKARLDENAAFTDIWAKTKDLMEGADIESVKVKTGNLEDIKKKAPEATKHVEGSVSKDKGTQAPAAKEGDLDDAVSHAPEAKKHVEGSVSTEKGTKAPAPKNGNWEDVKKKSADATKHVTLKESEAKDDEEEDDDDEEDTRIDYSMGKKDKNQMPKPPKKLNIDITETEEIESVKVGEKNWDKITVPHAADAKKDIHMFKGSVDEGVKIGENFFAPLSEEMDDYVTESEEEEEEQEEDENTEM